MLIDLINSLRNGREGGEPLPTNHAVRQGARDGLRRTLAIALLGSVAFVRMAMANGAGAGVQRPPATVVIGGIVTFTSLTLLLLPSLGHWLAGMEASPPEPELQS